MDDKRTATLSMDEYHRPTQCAKCGGVMVFKGVGEYECEDCKAHDYDDYGKVRLYIEAHRGATAMEVERETGVSQRAIRQMLREERLEVSPDSKAFLHCELCGVSIRSGRYCPKCEIAINKSFEDQIRNKKIMQGFGMAQKPEDGARRFRRDE